MRQQFLSLFALLASFNALPQGLREEEGQELGAAFVEALRSDHAASMLALGVNLNKADSWTSVRTLFDSYEDFDVQLARSEVKSEGELEVEIDGTAGVLGPSIRRIDLPRCWHLTWTRSDAAAPAKVVAVVSVEGRVAKEMASAAADKRESLLAANSCLRAEEVLKGAAYLAPDQGEAGLALTDWVASVARQRRWHAAEVMAVRMRADIQLKQPALAEKTAFEALKIAEAWGDPAAIVSTRHKIATAKWYGGDLDSASEYFRSTEKYIESTTEPLAVLQALYMAAILDSSRKPIREMFERGDELLALLERYDAPRSRMDVLFFLAVLQSRLHHPEGVTAYTTEALKAAREVGDARAQAMALHGLAGNRVTLRDMAAAHQAIDEALALEPTDDLRVELLILRARVHQVDGRHDDAENAFRAAIAAAHKLKQRNSEANSLHGLAEILLAKGQHDASRVAAEASLLILQGDAGTERIRLSVASWPTRTILGKALQRQGHLAEAEAQLRLAITDTEAKRDDGGSAVDRSRGLVHNTSPYTAMLELLFDQNRFSEALVVAEQVKARALGDVLAQGQVDSSEAIPAPERDKEAALVAALSDLNAQVLMESVPDKRLKLNEELAQARTRLATYRAELYARHPRLRSVRVDPPANWEALALGDGTAAVEFVVLPERTLAFIVRSDKGKVTVEGLIIDVRQEELQRAVEELAEQLARRDASYRQTSKQLGRLLMDPLRQAITGSRQVVVVPDGVLWRLPLSVVAVSETAAELQVAYFRAPSLQALAVARALPSRDSIAPRLLALGNPTWTGARKDPAGLFESATLGTPLPEAEKEVASIAKLFGKENSVVLTHEHAKESAFKAGAGGADVIHLAVHGRLDDAAPIYSSLLLAPGEGNEDGLLEAGEIAEMSLNARIAVLSACDSGRGRVSPGEGLIGMSWAFLAAGVKTVVVSDWRTDSAASEILLVDFHRRLLAGTNPAIALREAQAELRRERRYKHPYYWAAFVVVGVGD